MEPDAIWIYHPDGRASFERILPSDAVKSGWSLYHDFRDLQPSSEQEKPVQAKIEGHFPCDICGKVLSTPLALSGHKRSH